MDKVVSYSLFRNNPAYYEGVDILVLAHHAIFKGFELRIHCDSNTKTMPQFGFLEKLNEAGKLKLVFYEEERGHLTRAMMWRILPLWEGFKFVFTRDIDSLPMVRDRAMVEEFMATDCAVHNIADGAANSPTGGTPIIPSWVSTPLMGGCMGFNVERFFAIKGFANFEDFMRFSGHDDAWFDLYANDEVYLREKIWPLVQRDTCMHVTGAMAQCPFVKLSPRDPKFELVKDVDEVFMREADKFANNVCAKWWRYEDSRKFYRKHGDAEILRIIYP